MGYIFIVILLDRHTDTQLFAYILYNQAKSKADEIVAEYDNQDEDENDYKYDEDFLFMAQLNGEGDNVSIQRIPLNMTNP